MYLEVQIEIKLDIEHYRTIWLVAISKLRGA
jgi:hypothetical protein